MCVTFPTSFLKRACPVFPGLLPGDEILVLNGQYVSGLDLALIQTLFAEQTLHLSLRRAGPLPPTVASDHLAPPLKQDQEVRSKHHRAKSSSGAKIQMTLNHIKTCIDLIISRNVFVLRGYRFLLSGNP